MTADIRILKPRKPKRLASITYPPELLPTPDLGDDVSVIVSCNRPDCIGEVCPYCAVDTGKLLTEIFKAQQKLYGPKGKP